MYVTCCCKYSVKIIDTNVHYFTDGDKETIGKVILLPDKDTGGIKSRSFVNVTFGKISQ